MNQTLLATTIANHVISETSKDPVGSRGSFVDRGLHFTWRKDEEAVYVEVRNKNGELLEVRQPL